MPRINLYLADPAIKTTAEALVKRRNLNSISELFAMLIQAEAKRRRGVRRGKGVAK